MLSKFFFFKVNFYLIDQVEFYNKDIAFFFEKYNDMYRFVIILMLFDGIYEVVVRNWVV